MGRVKRRLSDAALFSAAALAGGGVSLAGLWLCCQGGDALLGFFARLQP